MILEGSSGTISVVLKEEEVSRPMGCDSPDEGLPQPTGLLPPVATAPNELLGIPPPVAAEAGGCQLQLELPCFLPLDFCFPRPRPGVLGKDRWASFSPEVPEGAVTCTGGF